MLTYLYTTPADQEIDSARNQGYPLDLFGMTAAGDAILPLNQDDSHALLSFEFHRFQSVHDRYPLALEDVNEE